MPSLQKKFKTTQVPRPGELFKAIYNDRPERVKALLARGADVNEKDKHGMSALVYASSQMRGRIVRLLIKHGADIEADTGQSHAFTPLIYAVLWGDIRTLRLLLARGVDLDRTNGVGYTALDLAYGKGEIEALLRAEPERRRRIAEKKEKAEAAALDKAARAAVYLQKPMRAPKPFKLTP